ncbi:PQQ-binding-like beta-propeller repeat protein [Phenylobacterium sp. LH3H17]|uniref:outer membrane protein assembly factor BamB family protein n=1 Tax=Phenylobacterium sp. LH3H17 TaxID=2903901 RepID=UPI0020C970F3|nr:PQQ-binding-like beta-propeller repeat protein [Phenylobacterium sp. LH3H17]UTP37926.1 PQQ-binding-like beta-propeller repeat protein [Phenylobacterium sp. LH3H17]
MTSIRRNSLLVLLLAASLAVSGCSTINRLNPFNRGGDDAPGETASEGERISIVAADQKLEVAEALKGADFFLPTPATVTEWPLPGGTAEQSVGHPEAGGGLSIAWKRGFGQGSGKGAYVTAPPVAANGKVFVMDGEATVSAFDAQSGSQVWKANLRPSSKRDKEAFGGGLAVADGKLYVASGYRFVAQLNADTGAVVWKTMTEQPIHAAPTVSGGRLFVVAVDNTLLTFDTANGADGWTYQGLSESARILAASSPAVSGDTVVAAFGSGELVALRAANGNDLWNEALSRANRNNALSEIRDIPGRPVIYQGDVFAVSHSGVFAATDLRTGQARWSLPVTGITTPWPAGDVVYVVSKSGEVICVARESGQIYWIRDLGVGREQSKGGLFGMKFLGRKNYSTRPVWSSPILASNRIVLAGTSGELVAINAKTGEVEKTMNLGSPTLIGPIAVNGTIFVVTDEAQLIALR